MSAKKTFNEWFNFNDEQHLFAYKHFIKEKEWPDHFIPADIEVENGWELRLLTRMALAFVEMRTSTNYRNVTRGGIGLPFGGQKHEH